jgi:hypothetical protein
MDPVTITMLSLSIGSKLLEAFNRWQEGQAALRKMQEEGREPTAEEWAALRAAGAEADAKLDELLK